MNRTLLMIGAAAFVLAACKERPGAHEEPTPPVPVVKVKAMPQYKLDKKMTDQQITDMLQSQVDNLWGSVAAVKQQNDLICGTESITGTQEPPRVSCQRFLTAKHKGN